MSEWFKDTRTLSFEEILVDFAERLDRHRAGWVAAELHLSLLRPYHRQPHHARVVRQTLEALTRRHNASVYELHNGNVMVTAKGVSVADIDSVILQVRYLFSEDPLFKGQAEGMGEDAFCTWYMMEKDYAPFSRRVRQLNEDRMQMLRQEQDASLDQTRRAPSGQIMTPKQLEQIERAIEQADLANLLRRQDVCALIGAAKPEKIYHELYFSMLYLANTILPGFDLTSNAWLFRHLTGVLDRRMLALMTRRENFAQLKSSALNLNVATILSAEFLDFDKETNRPDRGALVIELPGIDILNAPADYLFARDFLRDRGYKIAIDGLSHLLLPALDREWLGFDFIKVHWTASLFDDSRGDRREALGAAIQRIGRNRVIMCRVDSKSAIQAGGDLGITLYQGRTIDAMAGSPGPDAPAAKKN